MNLFGNAKLIFMSRLDQVSNERLKRNLLNALPFWLGALLSGGVAVLYAWLFSLAEAGSRYVFSQASWSFLLLTPVCFVFAWWLVARYAPFARGSGIPQVTAAIELSNPKQAGLVNPLLSIRVIVVKIISSLIMVFGGGAVGREGPTIQIAASIFKKINDILPSWYPKISRQNMIVTGAAAGLAAAFNTPLGGIVFAIEELTKTHFSLFKSALLTGVIIAGLTALSILGPYLYLGYPNLSRIGFGVAIPIVLLAAITGLAGSGMGQAILYLLRRKKRWNGKVRQLIFLLIAGLVMATIAIFIHQGILGSGKELMVSTLFTNEKELPWYMPLLRIFGPVLSFVTGASGGVFAPSLSAGASLGAVVAGWFHLNGPATNLVILCGMTGFLTSITRSPFTSSILVLEMTNSHNVIFFIMLAGLLSNLVANLVSRHSFYEHLKSQYLHDLQHPERAG